MEKTFAYGIKQKVLCPIISNEFYGGIAKVYKVVDHIQYGNEDYIIECVQDKVQYPVSEHELVAIVKGQKPYVLQEITCRVHDYAKEHLVGKENAMSGKSLAELFQVSERAFRGIRANHNDPRSQFHHLLLSCSKGYFIAAAPTVEEMKQQYLDTAYRLVHHAVSELKEAKALIANTKLDGTMRLKLTPYMKEIVEIGTLMGDE